MFNLIINSGHIYNENYGLPLKEAKKIKEELLKLEHIYDVWIEKRGFDHFSRIIWNAECENMTLCEYLDLNPEEEEIWNKASEGLSSEELFYLQNK